MLVFNIYITQFYIYIDYYFLDWRNSFYYYRFPWISDFKLGCWALLLLLILSYLILSRSLIFLSLLPCLCSPNVNVIAWSQSFSFKNMSTNLFSDQSWFYYLFFISKIKKFLSLLVNPIIFLFYIKVIYLKKSW